ncbi:MAG: hypothetical protein B7Y35_06100 [Sphingomonadales bacterium 28-64-96]|nr:MAG: hypothetical protein B7Y35_06100 [Sphingomonadales bacterium 28-64-96]
MIPTSAAPQLFTPPWYLQDGAIPPGAPVYLVRPGSIADRAMFEGVIGGPPWNAGRVFPWDLIDAAERAVTALLDGDARGQVLEALATWRANMATPEAIPHETTQLLAGLEMALRTWPEYGQLRAAESRRTHALPVLAAQWFLVGWQNVDQPFTLGPDGKASEASLSSIPAPNLNALGWYAYNLMYAEQHRPLSPPPSTSEGSPSPSSAAGSRRVGRAGGKSKDGSGKRIRG